MNRRQLLCLCSSFVCLYVAPRWLQADRHSTVRHVTIYREEGRFAGFPANHGIWIWGNEILVGFSRGFHKDLGPNRHSIDRERPEEHLLARSLDGGETWSIENPGEHGSLLGRGEALHGSPVPGLSEPAPTTLQRPIDFLHPDLAFTVRMSSVHVGPSRYYVSYDRGKSWSDPYSLPSFGQKGIAGRTDYLVGGKRDCLLFLTAAKANGREGRPICVATADGGLSWKFLSFIGPEPEGFSIMPSTVRVSEVELLSAVRRREGSRRWIDLFASADNGESWRYAGIGAADTGEGNPPSMIRLRDGRVCLTYGVRARPFGIRARLSRDGGHTWTPEITLRDDGSGRDVGYVRSVQRGDGSIVSVYYFQDHQDPYRHLAATIWTP